MLPLSARGAARWLPLVLLCALSACGGGSHRALVSGGPASYTPPGPGSDPWGPYIREAAARFDVPQAWVRAVIRQESGGRAILHGRPITSDAGAAGLMQVMPTTYAELAARYGLGPDVYDPHDNIMAGTAYIRELYDRYGAPAFLAAYDAGPHRLDTYLAGAGTLPNETVNYLASAAPALGRERPMTGPLAAFATTPDLPPPGPVPHAYAQAAPAGRCWRDPDAAYDPTAPCAAPPAAPVQVAATAPDAPPPVPAAADATVSRAGCWQDPDAAYDPTAPCRPAPPPAAAPPRIEVAEAAPRQAGWGQGAPDGAYAPVPAAPAPVLAPQPAPVRVPAPAPYRQPAQAPFAYAQASPPSYRPAYRPSYQVAARERPSGGFLIASAHAATVRPVMATGRWAIQVGAFGSPDAARRTAERVRALSPRELSGTTATVGTTAPFGGQVLYRARLLGLSADTAFAACGNLQARAQACVTVPPGG